MQTDAPAIALVALVAAERAVQGELAVLVGVAFAPAGQHGGAAGLGVLDEALGVEQLRAKFGEQQFHFGCVGMVGLLAGGTGAWPAAAPECRAARRRS